MSNRIVKEGLSDEAHRMEVDHEVQMARSQLFNLARDAIELHKLLNNISEHEGLEGWVQSKITLAADYVETVLNYMEYQQMLHTPAVEAPVISINPVESVGGMSAGAVASVPMPMGTKKKKPLIRR